MARFLILMTRTLNETFSDVLEWWKSLRIYKKYLRTSTRIFGIFIQEPSSLQQVHSLRAIKWSEGIIFLRSSYPFNHSQSERSQRKVIEELHQLFSSIKEEEQRATKSSIHKLFS